MLPRGKDCPISPDWSEFEVNNDNDGLEDTRQIIMQPGSPPLDPNLAANIADQIWEDRVIDTSRTRQRGWIRLLITQLGLIERGIPHAIISDRDPKFVGQIWKGIFTTLDIKLLYEASYMMTSLLGKGQYRP